jgi:hypothetical protein
MNDGIADGACGGWWADRECDLVETISREEQRGSPAATIVT